MNAPPPISLEDPSTQIGTRDDPTILLAVLDAIHANDAPSQRSIASDVGIALGMANAYVKRCVKKGYVKLSQAPANRYLYYLTPTGLAEKARLASDYLQQSLNLFREARGQYAALVAVCAQNGWTRVALAGGGDMAEIALLCTVAQPMVQVMGIVGAVTETPTLAHLATLAEADLANRVDAVLVTSISGSAEMAARLALILPQDRILVPKLLMSLRFRSDPPKA
jgi:DNA-binding MarR family transcriptional regulator